MLISKIDKVPAAEGPWGLQKEDSQQMHKNNIIIWLQVICCILYANDIYFDWYHVEVQYTWKLLVGRPNLIRMLREIFLEVTAFRLSFEGQWDVSEVQVGEENFKEDSSIWESSEA